MSDTPSPGAPDPRYPPPPLPQGDPGSGHPAQGYPGPGYPGQGYPGQSYPGYPGQGYPGQGYPGQPPPPPPGRWSTGAIVAVVVAIAIGAPGLIVIGTYLFGATVRDLFTETGEAPRDAQGRVTEAHQVPTAQVRPGDCITDSGFAANPPGGGTGADRAAFVASEVATVTVVPCSEPHEVQVYFAGTLAGGPYPGETTVLHDIERSCRQEFTRSIGLPLRESELFASYYYPLEQSWAKDKGYACVVSEKGLETTGSLLDARR